MSVNNGSGRKRSAIRWEQKRPTPRVNYTQFTREPGPSKECQNLNLRPLDTITAAMLVRLSIGSTTVPANYFFQAARTTT